MFRSEDRGARQNWSKPAISWESKLKTAVGTTDFGNNTDNKSNIAPSVQSVQSVVNSRSEGNERRTTDYTDYTDKEGIGVQGVYTRRVAAKEVLGHDEARSHPCHPCHPCHPWFEDLSSALRICVHRCSSVVKLFR